MRKKLCWFHALTSTGCDPITSIASTKLMQHDPHLYSIDFWPIRLIVVYVWNREILKRLWHHHFRLDFCSDYIKSHAFWSYIFIRLKLFYNEASCFFYQKAFKTVKNSILITFWLHHCTNFLSIFSQPFYSSGLQSSGPVLRYTDPSSGDYQRFLAACVWKLC